MTLQEIKKLFFAYRNGVVADTLRRSGMSYDMIFGCDIPTLSSIARKIGFDERLAEELWNDCGVRESRLLATYLFDPSNTDMEKAIRMASEVRTREEADLLTFRLLKRLPYARELAERINQSPTCLLTAKSLSNHLS